MKNKASQDVSTEDEAVVGKKEGKGKKIANTIINVILVIAIVIAALCTYISFVSKSGSGVPSIFGIEILSIQTESMHPTIEPGDLIFDKRVKDTSTLQVGDIITYWTIIDGERVLNTHRIVEIYDGGNYRIFATKGDKNDVEDPLTVHESEVVGKYNGARIRGAGKVFDFLQTSTGFLIVVVVPVAIFFIFHLVQFFRVLFEYQNVKNRLAFEQERENAEEDPDEEKKKLEELRKEEREKLEAELREKLKAELMASGADKPGEGPAPEKAKTEAELRAEIEAELRAKLMAEAQNKDDNNT
jgi:signal peptidase